MLFRSYTLSLHQIQFGFACDLQGFLDGHDTDIPTIWTDQADFHDADALIYSKLVGAYMLLLVK